MTSEITTQYAAKTKAFLKGYEVLSTSFPSIFKAIGKQETLPLSVVRNKHLKEGELTLGVHLKLGLANVQLKWLNKTDPN